MRRLIPACLVFAAACLNGTSPTGVNGIFVTSNVTQTGVFAGDSIQLNAQAQDAFGNTLAVPLTYSSSNTTVATVNTAGLIHALAPGTSTITVVASGQTAHLNLTVDANIEAGVQVAPATASVAPGQPVTLTYTITTSLGNPARSKTANWSTADATKVSVTQAGIATGVAATAGVNVCATAADNAAIKACAVITVTP